MSYAIELSIIFTDKNNQNPNYQIFDDLSGFTNLGNGLFQAPTAGISGAKTGFSPLLDANIYELRFPNSKAVISFLETIITAEREALLSTPPIDEFGPSTISILGNQQAEAKTRRADGELVFSVGADGKLDDPNSFSVALQNIGNMPRGEEFMDDDDNPDAVDMRVPPGKISALKDKLLPPPSRNRVFYVGSFDEKLSSVTETIFASFGISQFSYQQEDEDHFYAEGEGEGFDLFVGSVLQLPQRDWMRDLSSLVSVELTTHDYVPELSIDAMNIWADYFGLCVVVENDPDDDHLNLKGMIARKNSDPVLFADIVTEQDMLDD